MDLYIGFDSAWTDNPKAPLRGFLAGARDHAIFKDQPVAERDIRPPTTAPVSDRAGRLA
jgi:hypothetical protein